MPAGSELVESTEPSGTPGTFPMCIRVMGGLTNACSPFGGPVVEMKGLWRIYGMGSSMQSVREHLKKGCQHLRAQTVGAMPG